MVFCASLIYWLQEPYPLSHVHWDSAVYLLEAKDFAQGELLSRLRERAQHVSDELAGGGFPREYWVFTRLGHIVAAGLAVVAFGTDEASVGRIVAVYRLLFAAALIIAAMLPGRLVTSLASAEPRSDVQVGAVISLALYLFSDIASYMSGNLVSEVPALLCVSLAAYSFTVAWQRQSWPLAALSGCLGWLLYVTRTESIWLFVSFVIAFALVALPASRERWKVIAIAGACAAVFFAGYSLLLFPLTDPRLFVISSKTGLKLLGPSTGSIVDQVIAANGLLWAGAILAVPTAASSRATRLGLAWLLLALIPVAAAVQMNYGTQTRMFTTLTPPLLVLSALGWANLLVLARRARWAAGVFAFMVIACVGAIAISQERTYSYLRELPGMWRLQSARMLLASKRFERIDYHLPELFQIRRALAAMHAPAVVIASAGMQSADHIMIVQFVDADDAAGRRRDAKERSPALEVQLSSSDAADRGFVAARAADKRMLLLGTVNESEWFGRLSERAQLRDVVVTPNFRLVELVPAPAALAHTR